MDIEELQIVQIRPQLVVIQNMDFGDFLYNNFEAFINAVKVGNNTGLVLDHYVEGQSHFEEMVGFAVFHDRAGYGNEEPCWICVVTGDNILEVHATLDRIFDMERIAAGVDEVRQTRKTPPMWDLTATLYDTWGFVVTQKPNQPDEQQAEVVKEDEAEDKEEDEKEDVEADILKKKKF